MKNKEIKMVNLYCYLDDNTYLPSITWFIKGDFISFVFVSILNLF